MASRSVNALVLVGGPVNDKVQPLFADQPFPLLCSKQILAGGGAKLVDHIINALLDADVERIFLMGTYEERYFYDYCHRRSIETERQIK
jgi:NDP-sugar pyrophosphorylase family protein